MEARVTGGRRAAVRSSLIIGSVVLAGAGATLWRGVGAKDVEAAATAAEPMEVVTAAVAQQTVHRQTTTSIGTVLATRSITLKNEVPGTVREVRLVPGQVVDAGVVLVALDTSVETAELAALEARADLARTTLARYERMAERQAASAIEVDQARAEHAIATAEMARVRAVIERKTIRAPFPARVGIADVHPGQFLDAGTRLTTLQGVAGAVDVDFAVAQDVAAALAVGTSVSVETGSDGTATVPARVTAVDARVDPTTRNAVVRARVDHAAADLTPGSSVRVSVPTGPGGSVVTVPASALRRGPAGDHVFVLEADEAGAVRARMRSVEAGPLVGDAVVVLQGLDAGERVAADGSFKLWEGVLVSVTEEPAARAEGS
ncbi:MAG: efflux RND transporter periplasmic adaptor subunit [Longimicrobiales bacterium]